VGTGANQIVALDATAKLPAVDGSQLTNLPSGATAFVDLTDVPNAYTGAGGKVVTVKGDVSGLEFTPAFVNPMTAVGDIIVGGTAGAATALTVGTDTEVLTLVSGTPSWEPAPQGISGSSGAIQCIIDGGGSVIPTGIAGDVYIPFAATITSAAVFVDAGTITIDIWKDTDTNYPPTDADSITSGTPITLITGTWVRDSAMTGWDKALNVGRVLRFNVDACTTTTMANVVLTYTRA
jgi:hypothetical protein